MAALQGDRLTGSGSFLAQSSSFQSRSGGSAQLSSTRHSQRSNDLNSTHHSLLPATARSESHSSPAASAAHAVQISPSLQSTSKSSRYLQKHLQPRPSALQQLQAFSDRHSKVAGQDGLADDSAALHGSCQLDSPHLPDEAVCQPMQHEDQTASLGSDQVDQVEAARCMSAAPWLPSHPDALLKQLVADHQMLICSSACVECRVSC